jgi:hypothetical protein
MFIALLLEKLYGHKADLEFMMHVYETHYSCKNRALADQYITCLNSIHAYEMLLQQHIDELYSDNSCKQY